MKGIHIHKYSKEKRPFCYMVLLNLRNEVTYIESQRLSCSQMLKNIFLYSSSKFEVWSVEL